MDNYLEKKYHQVFEGIDELTGKRKEAGQLTAMGFSSNLDLLCDFKTEHLNVLLKEHMAGRRFSELKVPALIRDMQELLSAVAYFCIKGIGGEVDVENTELVMLNFSFTNGMGGTAVQAAMALSELSCPTLVHLTDDSREVCEILDKPSIHIIDEKGELSGAMSAPHKNEQELHFIIQFKKGDPVRLGDETIEIPCSNRLILTKNTVNVTMPFDRHYFDWIEKNADRVTSDLFSSFNCILDTEVLKERLQYLKGHAQRYRRGNPRGIVFFEDAHYHDAKVRKLCMETIYPEVDIVSLNEEELSYTLNNMYDIGVDIDDIDSVIRGAEFLIERLGIHKGIIVHTKDYAMYTGRELEYDIEDGLMMGNLMATSKAKYGWYGTKEQMREVLELPMSSKGLKNYDRLKERAAPGYTVIVPSRYIDKPEFTIGLGDSFTGGVQLSFS